MSRLQVDAPILRLPFDVWDVIVRSIDYDDWIFESSLDHALRRRRDVARLRVTCVCLRELLESEEFYDTCTNWGGPHSSFPTFRGYTATARPTFDPDVCGRWISRLNRRPHLRGRVSTVTMTDWACHSFFSRVGHHAVHQALLTRFWLEVPKFVQLNALHLFSVAIASEAHRTIRNLATLRHLDLQQCTIWHIDLAEYRSTPALAVETVRRLPMSRICSDLIMAAANTGRGLDTPHFAATICVVHESVPSRARRDVIYRITQRACTSFRSISNRTSTYEFARQARLHA